VLFGGMPGQNLTIFSDSSASVTAPTGSGSVQVAVVGPGGTSRDNVVYIYLAPVVTSVTPASGSVFGGTNVAISGANFTGASGVQFGLLGALSFTVLSDTLIVAKAPPNLLPTVDIRVTTPAGTSATGPGDQFRYF